MSRALVIKDSDFSIHKVATVTLSDVAVCEGISLSQSEIAFTAIGATVSLTATLTPASTTQTILWVSSNPNVATVSNGTVSCTGVGSCMIMAICGAYSATCSVSSTVVVTNADLAYINKNPAISKPDGKDYLTNVNQDGMRVWYETDNPLEAYRIGASSSVYGGKYPIPIPNGTTKIRLQYDRGFSLCPRYALFNSKTKSVNAMTDNNECCKVLYYNAGFSGSSIDEGTYRYHEITLTDKDPTIDCFVFGTRVSGVDASTLGTNVTIIFS